MFSITSRYYGIPAAVLELPDGRKVAYIRRRFVPRPEVLAQISEHQVRAGERIDHIAFDAYGDAELSWRLADANRAMDPEELIEVGRRLRITLPAGIPGAGLTGQPGGAG